ncbi:MAG TPA: abortive phage infection protein [Ruminococcaceae bacterium]|jgi:predicted transcriptional regulator of viral defense system|nr:abortive phage infection protein [Clostridiales bacterium]HBT64526.1 abortive phage infection protein [Oscillospiraceae bacterium]
MTQFEQLNELMNDNNGIIRTAQALAAGISKPTFYAYVKQMYLKQVAHGVYMSQDAWPDSMYVLHLRSEQAIFSHETALFLHDLTDREPQRFSITVKADYHSPQLKAEGVKVYWVKKELHKIGLTIAKTSFGNSVPVYDAERTVCDIIRNRSNIETQTFQDTLKQYARRTDKDLGALMKYAALFRVDTILRQYLEVLL